MTSEQSTTVVPPQAAAKRVLSRLRHRAMRDPIPFKGPVELVDGKLILRIPLDRGGVGVAALALGIGEVDGEYLNVVIQPWLADKLRIGLGNMVFVFVDMQNGNFTITRSAEKLIFWGAEKLILWGAEKPIFWGAPDRRDQPFRQPRTRTTKWLAALNGSAAVASVAVLPVSSLEYPSDPWLVYLTVALFGLAAVAHWRRWPSRWLVQGFAIALPVVIFLLSLT